MDRMHSQLLLLMLLGAVAAGGCQGSAATAEPSATLQPTPTASPSPTTSPTTQQGVFVLAGATIEPRQQHAAAVLRDGRILLVGDSVTRAAEIYDPSTGTSTTTGSLLRRMISPTAVALPDGRVLVIGVWDEGDPVATEAELYDPSSGKFTAARPPIDRGQPAVSLLADGRVLIAGGGDMHSTSVDCLASADLFDPATGKFTRTGSMRQARAGATATTLPDGRVLIPGGSSCGTPQSGTAATYATAEIYDPASGRFTPAGDMSAPRWSHTATLLADGRVLLAGGFSYSSGYKASADIFDPKTNTFTAAGPMSVARAYHVAALLPDGRVLVAGGENDESPIEGMASAEVFDPATGTFIAAGSMHSPRSSFTATLLANGEVLIIGGNALERSCELYRP
jgi:hypothetical protein